MTSFPRRRDSTPPYVRTRIVAWITAYAEMTHKLSLAKLITHRFQLDDAESAIATVAKRLQLREASAFAIFAW